MSLEFNFKQNVYFIKEKTENEITLIEISKTFIRLYKSGRFDLNWLKSKALEIRIKINL